jgi:hypothetical protein
MPLIDANNSGKASAHVVEQFFDNRDINAEPCHTAGDGAPDVVQDPLRHRRRKLIDPALYQMSAADRIAAAYREHKLRAVDARESGQ